MPFYAISFLFTIGLLFFGFPYFIYRLIKGLMTHHHNLKEQERKDRNLWE